MLDNAVQVLLDCVIYYASYSVLFRGAVVRTQCERGNRDGDRSRRESVHTGMHVCIAGR